MARAYLALRTESAEVPEGSGMSLDGDKAR
jgi:hypothetical protein